VAISTPSLILAFIKLRKRNLGPILDANGWALNAKAKINVPLGTSLTSIAKLPAGATVDVAGDKFAQHSARWPKFAVTAFLIWWLYAFVDGTGILHSLTDGHYGHELKISTSGSSTNTLPGTITTNAPAAK